MNKEKLVIKIVAVVIVAIGFFYWYFFLRRPTVVNAPAKPLQPAAQKPVQETSLGGTILNQAQNPVQNKLPDTSPKVNPIEGVYKNPFR